MPISSIRVIRSFLEDLPAVRQQEVDQGGHVADVDRAVLVAVGVLEIEAGGVVREQVVDQGRHVADVDVAVAVHVTAGSTRPYRDHGIGVIPVGDSG